jgi:hypothetical protein
MSVMAGVIVAADLVINIGVFVGLAAGLLTWYLAFGALKYISGGWRDDEW